MFYDFFYNPLMEDLENDCSLKLSALVKIMANAGMYHSDKANDNLVKITQNNRGWVLLDWKVEFLKYPEFGKTIKCTTWLETFKSPFGSNRNFELTIEDELCVRASSKLIFMDLSTGKPTKVLDETIAQYQPEAKVLFGKSDFEKLTEPDSFDSTTEVLVRRSDIDFNAHVHNLCYIDYALEALPESVYKNRQFSKMQIVYKYAVKDLSTIQCKYTNKNGNHLVSIFDQNNNLCTLVEFSK